MSVPAFKVRETGLPGCRELSPPASKDARGAFVKTFHAPAYAALGLNASWAEEYYSVSKKGVLRGLHFQVPPADHAKLVYCTSGAVLDAVLDLRRGSPTYGQHRLIRLSSRKRNQLYIPQGLAHGFYVTSSSATMVYKTSTVYAPDRDAGIRWDTAGIAWPDPAPLLSERDRNFPSLADFRTPFAYP